MPRSKIPKLKVEGMIFGPKAAGVDLTLLLYEGAASMNRQVAARRLAEGELGNPMMERLPILQAIHKRWQCCVTEKTLADSSIGVEWSTLKVLVAYAEKVSTPFTVENAMRLYLNWASRLAKSKSVSQTTKHGMSSAAARFIAPVIGMDARRLQWKTKLRPENVLSRKTAKENLEETGAFIELLLDSIQQLPAPVVRGPLPVVLQCGNGVHEINCAIRPWRPLEIVAKDPKASVQEFQKRRDAASKDVSNEKRAQLINLRIEAEMLVFINQTGCNLSQALQLTGGRFRYQSDGDVVWVLSWKNRAKHAVRIRIARSYRPHFEAYLKWRDEIFPDDKDGQTFPFICSDGDMAAHRFAWGFDHVRRMCRAVNKPFVGPQQLRKTIGNFVNRRLSAQDAAELLGNSEKTFREHYEEPNFQRAAAELVNFMGILEGLVVNAVGPGRCKSPEPAPIAEVPVGSPKPDCEGAAGCLFCANNRDLRSFDHAWNLASLCHLFLLEFNADRTIQGRNHEHPARRSAERAAAKLDAMSELDDECAKWVHEARTRVSEGRYHPHHVHKFSCLEGSE